MTEKIKVGIESGTFDNFALSCYRNCPTYYRFRIVKGVVKPGAKKTAADFGSAVHLCFDYYYKHGMTTEAIQKGMALAADFFEKKQDVMDEKRSLAKLLEILANYFQRYHQKEPFNVIDTEIGGAVELGEYLYTFRIDLLTEWISPKGIYPWDHKTTYSISRMVVKPNNQITGYDYAVKLHYPNVLGFMVNVIGVYSSTEEMDKSAPKVKSPKTGRMIYATKQREIFVRMPTSRSQVEVEQWKKETLHLIHQIEESQNVDVWPKRSPEHCSAYASRCQYLDLCQAQDPDSILDALLDTGVYIKEDWTPYLGEGGGDENGETE